MADCPIQRAILRKEEHPSLVHPSSVRPDFGSRNKDLLAKRGSLPGPSSGKRAARSEIWLSASDGQIQIAVLSSHESHGRPDLLEHHDVRSRAVISPGGTVERPSRPARSPGAGLSLSRFFGVSLVFLGGFYDSRKSL